MLRIKKEKLGRIMLPCLQCSFQHFIQSTLIIKKVNLIYNIHIGLFLTSAASTFPVATYSQDYTFLIENCIVGIENSEGMRFLSHIIGNSLSKCRSAISSTFKLELTSDSPLDFNNEGLSSQDSMMENLREFQLLDTENLEDVAAFSSRIKEDKKDNSKYYHYH